MNEERENKRNENIFIENKQTENEEGRVLVFFV